MKKKKVLDSDYLYASARIRALENGICSAERLSAMAGVKSKEELFRLFEQAGVISDNQEIGTALDARLSEAFALVSELSGCSMFELMRYPYDAHNLKSAVKGTIRETDYSHLLIDLGTVGAQGIVPMAHERDFSAFPVHMGAAAREAFSLYARTADPQKIDLSIDKACFRDMTDLADVYEFPFLRSLIAVKIDLVNILTTLRLIREGGAYMNAAFVRERLIRGGTIDIDTLAALIEKGEDALFDCLRMGDYPALAACDAHMPLFRIERAADAAYLRFVEENTKFVSYGPGVLLSYLVAREYEVKNLRILAASVGTGLGEAQIRERLRTAYV